MTDEAKYSIETGQIRTFGPADFALFSLVLLISASVGFFYAYIDRKNLTSSAFILAGQSMSTIPVALSLTVTFISALTLLGNPVEVYNFDTMFWWLCFGMVFSVSATAHIFMPFFFRLKIMTIFEYLQMRFNTAVRLLGSVVSILQTLVYFSFILYTPSLALSSVTHLSLWGSVVGIGIVVTLYTTLGGMKAVVWTDTLQAIIIFIGLLAAVIQGSILTDGFAKARKVAEERGRIVFDDFDPDPSVRHSFWSVVVGGGFFWMSLYGVNQAQIQRCISCPTVRKAQIALWISLLGIVAISSVCFMIGVVMFAFYANCHPQGIISKRDQLLPLYAMDILADFPGLPGIFVACIFCGSLSSLSSGLSAVSAVSIRDIVVPYCCPRVSDFKITVISKLLVVIYGCIGMAAAYFVSQAGGVLQASISIFSILNGPMFGLFILGMFFPWANSFGAFVGCIVSIGFMTWIVVGAFWYGVSTSTLSPVITTGCVWNNITVNATATTTTLATTLSFTSAATTAAAAGNADIPAYGLYTLSYLYYTITGGAVVVVVGLICSFISGYTKPSKLDPRLICPLFDTLFPCLPENAY